MLLYPTETVYALGVNALDEAEITRLFRLKGRDEGKVVSWLVRDVADIERWGVVSETARRVAARLLPGPLTLAVPARDCVPRGLTAPDKTISFRISPDPIAQQVIKNFMAIHEAPLTCTSANISGLPSLPTPAEIIEQFQQSHQDLPVNWEIHDDGPRIGVTSTVVRIINEEMDILRPGAISMDDILKNLP